VTSPAVQDNRPVRIGIDIGGTFTDLLLVNDRTGAVVVGKTLTTPDDPSAAVESETAGILEATGTPASDVQTVIHGTTLVTNTIIERKGDRTALLTTRGYRDALEIGREHRYDMYDMLLEMPTPLVPRHLRFEVDERMLADGTILRPLEGATVEPIVRALARRGIRAIAVSLLHAYQNPAHEQQIARIIADVAPELETSLSSEVVPEIREFERTSTTVANVYVKSLVRRYLGELQRKLTDLGITGELYVMLSSGGIATVETSQQFPVRLLESGPAAGALATAHLGAVAGYRDLMSFDMGGTTAKLCIIDDGQPLTASQIEVDRVYRFKKGSGIPVKIPVIELIEIGAGGGSIAHVDALGLLKIGPGSAGADPGPVCYGRGGTQPTVTDADLVLGYLDPAFFLGGRMRLDLEAATSAIDVHVAQRLGLSVTEAAWGIHQIVNENMANAARIHAVEHGKDPRFFPLFAFGGAGPVHASGVGAILQSRAFIVPPAAGVGSTIGFLTAPLAFDFTRTSIQFLDDCDWTRVNRLLAEMEREGTALLRQAGVAPTRIEVERRVDLRYIGQGHEVTVKLPDGELRAASVETIAARFAVVYAQLYGRVAGAVPLESMTWRVTVRGPRPTLDTRGQASGLSSDAPAALKGARPVYFQDTHGYRTTPVYDRYRLGPGASFDGPAIVEERECTVVVGPSTTASIDEYLNLLVRDTDES
jgi:N-methylhydantoinase A